MTGCVIVRESWNVTADELYEHTHVSLYFCGAEEMPQGLHLQDPGCRGQKTVPSGCSKQDEFQPFLNFCQNSNFWERALGLGIGAPPMARREWASWVTDVPRS